VLCFRFFSSLLLFYTLFRRPVLSVAREDNIPKNSKKESISHKETPLNKNFALALALAASIPSSYHEPNKKGVRACLL